MSPGPGRHQAGSLPGTVKVRLSGEKPALDALTAVLAHHPAVEILTGPDGPRRNRREPGHRIYLTVRIPSHADGHGGASAQPPQQSASPAAHQGGTSHDDP